MAPPRPLSVELVHDDGGVVIGVLVLRPTPASDPPTLAARALRVDARWSQGSIDRALESAVCETGRWFKTPDRAGGFILTKMDGDVVRAGATPGVMVRLFARGSDSN